jgi:hypothetical protein
MRYLVLLLVLAGWCCAAPEGTYSTGEQDPIQLATWGDYVELVATPNDWDESIIMVANIDGGGASIDPIGSVASGVPFSGSFDGDNFTLSNIIINGSDNSPDQDAHFALFTKTASGVEIKDLICKNITITSASENGTNTYCAILVAEHVNGATITNCHAVDCTINFSHVNATNDKYGICGMIAGSNHGVVTGCSSSGTIAYTAGTVSGTSTWTSIGGVVGYQTGLAGGSVGHCSLSSSTVTITANSAFSQITTHIGGIVGTGVSTSNANHVTRCDYNGTINVTNTTVASDKYMFVGGVVGSADFLVTKCSALGTIRSTAALTTTNGYFVGGIAGRVSSTGTVNECFANMDIHVGHGNKSRVGLGVGMSNTGVVTNCYAKGSLYDLTEGDTTVLDFERGGGFAGSLFQGTVTNCYAATSAFSAKAGNSYIHGFGNVSTVTPTACFWDKTIVNLGSDGTGFTGKTTEQMKTIGTFSGWDFDPADGRNWKMLATYNASACTYPYLDWQTYPYNGGSGTSNNPYRIKTLLDWNWAYGNIDNRSGDITTYFTLQRDSTLATEFMIIKKGGSSPSGIFGGSGIY